MSERTDLSDDAGVRWAAWLIASIRFTIDGHRPDVPMG